jgi:hypothetical protein
MIAKRLLSHILDDDALTRGLGDAEARILVEWLVEQAERLGGESDADSLLRTEVGRLCLKGRTISRFVGLWCHGGSRAAALQLASTERFPWPLPTTTIDPCELMQTIIEWEDRAASERKSVCA